MKFFIYSIFVLCLSQSIFAQATKLNNDNETVVIGPPLDPKVKELVASMSSFKQTLSSEYIQNQFETLPGITNQLIDFLFFELSMNTEEWGYQADQRDISIFLYGLSFRKDLSSSQIQKITDELSEYTKVDSKIRNEVQVSFLRFGVLALQNYSSPANEALALELLNESDIILQSNTIKTLSKIGTSKSIPALQVKAEEYKFDSLDDRYEEIMQAIRSINTREKQKNQASQSDRNPNNSTLKPKHAIANTPSPNSPSSGDSLFSFWWILWAIAIIIVVRIMWKLIRTLYDSF